MEKKVQNNLPKIVNAGNVRGYVDENQIAYLNAEDVARGLGFVMVRAERVTTSCDNPAARVAKSGNDPYTAVRWETVNRYLAEFDCPPVARGDFLPENMCYLLAMKANNKAAKAFQWKIATEILPSIRKYGYYSVNEQEEAQEPPVDNRRLAQTKPACVYCALMEDQTVKIGYTSDIRDRLQRIRRKYGKVAEKHFCSPVVVRNAAQRFEAQLKEQFAAGKVEGEFFSVAYEEVVEAIKNLPIEELPVEVPAPVEVPVPAAPIAPERLRLLADFVSALTESPFKEQFVRETANLIVGKKIF